MVDENKLFYKYQRIDGFNGNTIRNLIEHQLFFNDTSKFNDPFDSKVNEIFDGTEERWIQNFKEHKFNTAEIKQILKQDFIRQRNNRYVLKPTNKKYRQLYKEYHGCNFGDHNAWRVCCFSVTCSNILMWSHYADYHRGICLRFKFLKKDDEYFLTLGSDEFQLHQIKYDENLPPVYNILDDNSERMSEFLLTKYKDWEYEQEHRLILFPEDFDGEPIKKYKKEDLEGIIFGLKTPPDNIKMIYELIDSHYLKYGIRVNFYKAQEIQGKYAIKIKKIDNVIKYLKSLE